MGHASAAPPSCASSKPTSRRADSRPLLAQIRCPTLVLCGREDQILPLQLSEEMAAGIAGAKLVVLEGAGHMAPLEQPDGVTQAMREWLQAAGHEGAR